jgi:SAM-dependent methyltransferase
MPVNFTKDILKRTSEEIEITYKLEKELAHKLKSATREERLNSNLYTSAYNDFFSQLPQHPVQQLKDNAESSAAVVDAWMPALRPFLRPEMTFLEIGPGDCSLSLRIAKEAKKVYAVDVSDEVTKDLDLPPNFELAISDGCSIPVPENSVDVAYSHQMIEHLHPEDAAEQLQNLYKVLRKGGVYVCMTPNRLSGPHDTSKFFDDIATGWHLKEYTVGELCDLFRAAGFSKISYFKIQNNLQLELPLNTLTLPLLKLCEKTLEVLPASLRRNLALKLQFRGITIVGTK